MELILHILSSTEHEILIERKMQKATGQIQSERLFLNSINSKYTQTSYKFYLKRYLEICGYKEMDELLSRDHKQIE